jgi:hypothetical protein
MLNLAAVVAVAVAALALLITFASQTTLYMLPLFGLAAFLLITLWLGLSSESAEARHRWDPDKTNWRHW